MGQPHFVPGVSYPVCGGSVRPLLNPDALPFNPNGTGVPQSPQSSTPSDENFSDVLDIFLHTEHPDDVPVPAPCVCHNLPLGSCPTTIQEHIKLIQNIQNHPSGLPNMDGLRAPLPNPSLDADIWEKMLGSYFDASQLVLAFRHGWDMSLEDNPSPKDSYRNHPSAIHAEEDVQKYVDTELSFSAFIGPLPDDLPFDTFASPLGAVPKTEFTKRTITDCSQNNLGINRWIPANRHRGKFWKLSLPTTEDIAAAIARVRLRYPGQDVEIFKMDYSRYYRWFFIDPSQTRFTAVRWKGRKYLDRVFSFGNRGAMQAAQRTSWAVAWILRTQVPPGPGQINSGINCNCPHHCGCGDVEALPYVDDTIVIAPKSFINFIFSMFQAIVFKLGLALSRTPGHVVPPTSVCVGLGVEFNLLNNTVSLPEEKLSAILILLWFWLDKTEASYKELASLTGKLLYCCRVVRPGRLFLNRALETKRRATRSSNRPVPLDEAFREDLWWWVNSLRFWNGISILEFHPAGSVAVDASSDGWFDGSPGIGAYNFITNEFFASSVPTEMREFHISDLELLTPLVAARVWGTEWRGLAIEGLTDNQATHFFLTNGKSRVPQRLSMGRTFSSMQHRWDFSWRSSWLASEENVLPDCLSRWGSAAQQERFWATCREMGVNPVERQVKPEMFKFDSM